MSMKSFDKFCEKIILGEPGSEKEIFDERQKQQRTQLLVEAFLFYSVATAVLLLLNEIDETPRFFESSFSVLALCAGAAVLWWTIRAAVKGCLFGVSGRQTLYSSIGLLFEIPLWVIMIMPDEGEPPFKLITSRGLSEKAAAGAGLIFIAVSALITVIVRLRESRKSGK
ncbi:MAG: hypothetical protein J6B57_11265 [Oscillospiraceae bacterium]|nr:hypothetical protein [Oscillospiraceae bacterium]